MQRPITTAQLINGGNVIKQGHSFKLGFNLFDVEGTLVDLSGSTVTYKIAGVKSGVVKEGTATIKGVGHVEINVTDDIGNGEMRLEFTSKKGSVIQKYPANNWIRLHITPSLDDLKHTKVSTITVEQFQKQFDGMDKKANNALAQAAKAVTTSDSVRTELNQVVNRATDSDAMSAQAAVDAKGVNKGNLKKRLDDDYNELSAEMASTVKQGELVVSVSDYGVKGDGTDETAKVQTIINQLPANSVLKFPKPADFYNFTTLTIPDGKHFMKLSGFGENQSKMVFSSPIAFSVQSENITFEGLDIKGAGLHTAGSVIFKDERPNKRADFDIKVRGCFVQGAETVVQTKGRGVNIEGNNTFYEIRYQIIKADFPSQSEFQEGSESNQKYDTGFRGFVFRGNRIHYSPCVILNNTGANKENLRGVLISDNQLEGSTGYIEGYVKDGKVYGNEHYDCGNVRDALFLLHGCENLKIDINVSGMKLSSAGNKIQFNKLVKCTGAYKNLTIRANVQDVLQHVFEFTGGGSNLLIEVNANDISQTATNLYNLLKLEGATTYDGIKLFGTIKSPANDFTLVTKGSTTVVKNYDINVSVVGDYYLYHNLEASQPSVKYPITGRYNGNGTTQAINLKYKPQTVVVWSNDPSVHEMKQDGTSWLSPNISIGSAGFTVSNTLNTSGKIYAYIAY